MDQSTNHKSIESTIKDGLMPELTFESFVSGCNKDVKMACLSVAKRSDKSVNPLFIYAPSGYGKSHLLNAIGNYVKEHNPTTKVLYIPCLEFINEYIEHIKTNKIHIFNEKYRSLDILLVDDIQWLAGKEKSHEIFFQIFNFMILKNKQIVITGTHMPQDIPGLDQRLISRINSGLCLELKKIDFETAYAALKKKLEIRNFNIDFIDDDVLSFVATNFSDNMRVLEGAVNRLVFYAVLEKQPYITIEMANKIFSKFVKIKENEEDILSALDSLKEELVALKTKYSTTKELKELLDYALCNLEVKRGTLTNA